MCRKRKLFRIRNKVEMRKIGINVVRLSKKC